MTVGLRDEEHAPTEGVLFLYPLEHVSGVRKGWVVKIYKRKINNTKARFLSSYSAVCRFCFCIRKICISLSSRLSFRLSFLAVGLALYVSRPGPFSLCIQWYHMSWKDKSQPNLVLQYRACMLDFMQALLRLCYVAMNRAALSSSRGN